MSVPTTIPSHAETAVTKPSTPPESTDETAGDISVADLEEGEEDITEASSIPDEPVKPTESTNREDSLKPEEPSEPTDEVKPTEAIKPTEEAEPTEKPEPSEDTTASAPVEPTETTAPKPIIPSGEWSPAVM